MSKTNPPTELRDSIVQGMLEKKGQNILVLDLREIPNAAADFFIICGANNERQVQALANSVAQVVTRGLEEEPWHIEGKDNCEWVLLDYVDVVAHIFRKDRREFYALENLWGDAPSKLIPESQTNDAPHMLFH